MPSPKALSPSPTPETCRSLSVPRLSSLPCLSSTGGFQCVWEDTRLHHPAHHPLGLPDLFGTTGASAAPLLRASLEQGQGPKGNLTWSCLGVGSQLAAG